MLRYINTFERIITRTLLIMMAGVVLLATIELAWLLGKDLLSPPIFLLGIDKLLDVFAQFLLILIGIELLHTMKIYIEEHALHHEAMLIVALTAVTRKIVVLNTKESSEGTLLGIAAIVFALTLGYYLMQRSIRQEPYGEAGSFSRALGEKNDSDLGRKK
ncbi:membrane hypothetical protein [Gammaproteobacteria bacterium]